MANGNDTLVDGLVEDGVLRSPAIISAFRATDRASFVPPAEAAHAHDDRPLPIGHGQTISQPYTVAFMLELLGAQPGERVLDVGSGSGWTTALLAAVVGERGEVFGVEIVPELVRFGQENLARHPKRRGAPRRASIEQAGGELGLPSQAPFNRILVSAMGTEVPESLVEQLKVGGVMVLPVGNGYGAVVKVTKEAGGEIKTERHEGFAFVPLLES